MELEYSEFRLLQNELFVAGSCGPRDKAINDISNYAAIYRQDGPVRVQEKIDGKWQNL